MTTVLSSRAASGALVPNLQSPDRCMPRLRGLAWAACVCAALAWVPAASADFAPPNTEPDLLTGRDINGVCAGCHGDDGQGGKNGEYPRIAGLPLAYIYKQVKLFQQNARPNLPMLEHVHERQLSDQEILDRFSRITVWKRGGERAPHKPLLILYALARLQRGEPRLVSFEELDQGLEGLEAALS